MNGKRLELAENKLLSELSATHEPDNLTFAVVDVYTHSRNILSRTIREAIGGDGNKLNEDPKKGSDTQTKYEIAKLSSVQSSKIVRVACEIISKNLDRADPQETTISIFKILRGYTTWEAKLVLILAAFAINYGEFWLLVRSFSKDQTEEHRTSLAKSMAVLKFVSVDLMGNSTILGNLADWFGKKLRPVIAKLLKATEVVVEFFKIGTKYHQVQSLQTAKYYMSLEVNQIVLSILACVTEISQITDARFDFKQSASDTTWTQEWEKKLGKALDALQGQLKMCNDDIEKSKTGQICQKLESLLSVSIPSGDIFSVLEALIASTEQKALYRISDAKKWEAEVSITSFPPMTNVLFFISNLNNENNARQNEIKYFEEIYSKILMKDKGNLYMLMWIPIKKEPTPADENAFQNFATWMNRDYWYSVSKLEHIHQGVIEFIKDKWSFNEKTSILVVINQSGIVVNRDAYHMIRIWKEDAFPFDSRTEAKLWSEQPWNSDILIHREEDSVIKGLVGDENMYTFFCGGRDIKWLAYFLEESKKARASLKKVREDGTIEKFLLHTVYLGKNGKNIFDKAKGKLKSLKDDLIHCPEEDRISFFRKKLKSMKWSVSQQDAVMDDDAKKKKQGIQKLLSHDGGVGWVVLCKGTKIILNGYGSTMLALLEDFNKQEETVKSVDGFGDFFINNYDLYEKDYGICCSLDFPPNHNVSAEEHRCPHCGKYTMKKKIKLYCCHK